MKIDVLVVTYNKETLINDTTKSLLSQLGDMRSVGLTIFNNGPKAFAHIEQGFVDELQEKMSFINIVERVENNALSKVYNQFINSSSADYYMILDDDTKLKSDYFIKVNKIINDFSPDVLLPAIVSEYDHKLHFPSIDNKQVPIERLKLGVDLGSENICSVGSGLILSHKLYNDFCKVGILPFDDNFAFYGVDFTFFRRLRILKKRGVNISIYIVDYVYHDLSNVGGVISRARYIELQLDKILSSKYYSKSRVYSVGKMLFFSLQYLFHKDWSMFQLSLKTYFSGRHPRCINKSDDFFG